MSILKKIEVGFEKSLFTSRWIMAPLYLGMAIMLIVLAFVAIKELIFVIINISEIDASGAIFGALSLVDLSLVCNLLIIIMFSGYENFVSKMDIKNHEDDPEWRGSLDFTSLKIKVIESIVAISGIHLLKVFMTIDSVGVEHPELVNILLSNEESRLKWMSIIHVIFVVSGVLLSLMDRITKGTKMMKGK